MEDPKRKCERFWTLPKNCVRILSMAINAGETIELVVSGVDELVAFERLSNVFDKINSNNC
jgi:phosphotransferase system HPr-like phosphotransfer protein